MNEVSLTDNHDVNVKFARDGYVLQSGAVRGDSLQRLEAGADSVADGCGRDVLRHYERTDGGPRIARTERLLGHPALNDAILGGTLPVTASMLLGEPAVLYKEKINYKYPGGAGFAAHQDAAAYKFVDRHLTAMVAIDEATVDNGCLEVVLGTWDEFLAADDGRLEPGLEGQLDWQPVPMQPGDVLWFHSYVPHRSGPNRTATPRRALFCTYNAARLGDHRDRYYADKAEYFKSTEAGTARLSTIGGFLGVSPSPTELERAGLAKETT